jgi:L-amino acid N-acyltransferase YncA
VPSKKAATPPKFPAAKPSFFHQRKENPHGQPPKTHVEHFFGADAPWFLRVCAEKIVAKQGFRRLPMKTRPINPAADRDYVLECHCRNNYACDAPWARALPYESYRANWFAMTSQMEEFWKVLTRSAEDPRTIAELMTDETGALAGYFWAPFREDPEAGFSCLDVQDIYIEEAFRRRGLAARWLAGAEQKARACGAKVIRSGTGCENAASQAMHRKLGYRVMRYEYEKLL